MLSSALVDDGSVREVVRTAQKWRNRKFEVVSLTQRLFPRLRIGDISVNAHHGTSFQEEEEQPIRKEDRPSVETRQVVEGKREGSRRRLALISKVMAPRRHGNGHGGVLVENGGSGPGTDLPENNLLATQTTRCCTPTGECLRGDPLIRLNALHDAVKVTCNNDSCPVGQFMHRECFDAWEQTVLTYLKSCGRARSWSERQRHQNLWTKKGYDLAFKACGCRCGRGHLKKDLDWMPPGPGNANGVRPEENEAKKKKRRNRQNTRPSLAVSTGPPNHSNHVSANGRGTTEAQMIESVRGRAGSLSSSTGSSSPPATSEPSVSPLHQPQAIMKKKSKVDFFSDRARQSCGANGIFSRRLDFSAFNSLPRTKLNSYHIKVKIRWSDR